jgi:DNA-binding NtrC family response regulator
LPLHETEAAPDLEITTCIERNGSGTILVVDDEEHIRSLAARILKKAGYKVLSAKDGREAIRLFSARHSEISAVLLDLIMPVLDGRQCLKELLKIDPNAKVLISSGYAPENGTKESLDDLVKGFVWKPYNSDHLIKVLKNIL